MDSNTRMNVPFHKLYQAFVDVFTSKLIEYSLQRILKSYKFVEPSLNISGEEMCVNYLFQEQKLIPTFDRIIHSDQYHESNELVTSIKKHAALK